MCCCVAWLEQKQPQHNHLDKTTVHTQPTRKQCTMPTSATPLHSHLFRMDIQTNTTIFLTTCSDKRMLATNTDPNVQRQIANKYQHMRKPKWKQHMNIDNRKNRNGQSQNMNIVNRKKWTQLHLTVSLTMAIDNRSGSQRLPVNNHKIAIDNRKTWILTIQTRTLTKQECWQSQKTSIETRKTLDNSSHPSTSQQPSQHHIDRKQKPKFNRRSIDQTPNVIVLTKHNRLLDSTNVCRCAQHAGIQEETHDGYALMLKAGVLLNKALDDNCWLGMVFRPEFNTFGCAPE